MAKRGRPSKADSIKVVKKSTTIKAKKSTTKDDKSFIEPRYLKIKEYFKSKTYDPLVLNEMCMELIDMLGELTSRGITEIDGQSLDLWKMRTFVIIEKSGNLPPYRDEDDDILLDEDPLVNSSDEEWYGGEDDFGY